MLHYPSIDPIIIELGPVAIRWYGMMYLLGFLAAYLLGRRRSAQPWSPLAAAQVEDLIFYGAIGAVLGGRVGYVLFYGFGHFLADPLWLFRIWEGGMSFHGGLLGVLVALLLYARKLGQPLAALCDFVAPLAPLGLGFGRLANFINAELYGRATSVPWAMVFPNDPRATPRHPSQLYQFALEGLLLFAILWWYSRKPRAPWSVTGVFLVGYALARYAVEFFREPDAALAFGLLTRGQLLSLPMLLAGALMIAFGFYRKRDGSARNGRRK
ncbi:MAG: prolipoprotein diacylglyceryl transferase [Pseudomonadales bacterium]|nr:prolipoprotein diacylglyceryl transferase [Gammaproteobacteria bacterium]NNL57585.1 prolipoprotein diacylglyceryl transferase [Pseudomonadales bacterium]